MNVGRLAEDKVAKVAQGLKILSVETRLRIIMLLRERNLCVGALACRLGLTQGAVSQHLKVLHEAGLVTAERRGYYVHYRVNEDALARWRERIDELLEFTGPLSTVEKSKGVSAPAICKEREKKSCAVGREKSTTRKTGE